VGLVFTIIGVALAKPLVTRFGKRRTFQTCLFLSSMLMAAFALVPPDSFKTLLVLQVLLQLIFGPTIPILWAMMADVADYMEWRTGRRSTALAFASIIFAFKLGHGIGSWLNGQLLEYFGYSAQAALSTRAATGVVMMISVIPAVFLFVGAVVMFFYRLHDRLMAQIEQELSIRRNDSDLKSPIPSNQL
jgi:Na+/melibiose symporter-like transporter